MKYFFHIFILLLLSITSKQALAQSFVIEEKCILDSLVKESSGLIYFNNKIITHNDSGNKAILYEIDSLSGKILRKVFISNASNIDWEDLSQDSSHIYIADIGNNSGDRKDLKIYIIDKTQYLSKDSLTADTISFKYNNQTDVSSKTNKTRFDAEAISIYNDSIYVFIKDWVNYKTRYYVLPKTKGDYIAYEKDSFDCQGLITGSCFNPTDSSFLLTAYTNSLKPFIIYFTDFPKGYIFGGKINKLQIVDSIGAGQVEGICLKNEKQYFLSREEFSYQSYYLAPKLYSLNLISKSGTYINSQSKKHISVYPNPTSGYFKIILLSTKNKEIYIYDIYGRKMKFEKTRNLINISKLPKGIYILTIIEKENKYSQKIIKNY